MFSPEQTQQELDDLESRINNATTYVRLPLHNFLSRFINIGGPEIRERKEGSLKQLSSENSHLATRIGISALLEKWRKEHDPVYDYHAGYMDMYDDFEIHKTISRLRGEIALMKQTCGAANKINSPYARDFIEKNWSQIVQTNQADIASNFGGIAVRGAWNDFLIEEVISDIAAQLHYAENKEERAIAEGNILYVPVSLFFKRDSLCKNKRTRSIFELPKDDYDRFSRVFDYVYSKGNPPLGHILPQVKEGDAFSYEHIVNDFEKAMQRQAREMTYRALSKPAEEKQLN